MDLSGLVSWIPVAVFFGCLVVQRGPASAARCSAGVLNRQKENLAGTGKPELQRESIRLLGVIASKLDRIGTPSSPPES